MKGKIIFTLFILVTFFTLRAPEAHAQSDTINAKAFHKMKKKGAVVVDVRTREEFNEGYIPGAVLADIRQDSFSRFIKGLDPSKTYILYCRSGKRSAKAMQMMKENNISNVYHLDGGIEKWNRKKKKPATRNKN